MKVQNLKNQIGVASATIDMAGDLAQSFANGDFDNANTFEEQVQVFGNLEEVKKYTEVISSFIKGQVSDLVESMGLSSSFQTYCGVCCRLCHESKSLQCTE